MGDRKKRKQSTRADLNSNFRSLLPSQVVPRGRLKNALVENARGVGKSQFVIPDRWMKYPQNETSNVVDLPGRQQEVWSAVADQKVAVPILLYRTVRKPLFAQK